MSKRYTYSREITTPSGKETFTADQFDSFDEAQKAVEKGIHDRRLQLTAQKEAEFNTPGGKVERMPTVPPPSGGPMNAPFIPPGSTNVGAVTAAPTPAHSSKQP